MQEEENQKQNGRENEEKRRAEREEEMKGNLSPDKGNCFFFWFHVLNFSQFFWLFPSLVISFLGLGAAVWAFRGTDFVDSMMPLILQAGGAENDEEKQNKRGKEREKEKEEEIGK